MTCKLAQQEPSLSSMKPNAPLFCFLPVRTQPRTVTRWPASDAPPSERLRIDRIGTRFENGAELRVVVVVVGERLREYISVTAMDTSSCSDIAMVTTEERERVRNGEGGGDVLFVLVVKWVRICKP